MSQRKTDPMLLPVSFLFALAGAVLAGAGAFLSGTGIDGTPGAFLALAGALGSACLIGLLMTGSIPVGWRTVLYVMAVIVALLTALAAHFLMQPLIVLAMALAILALLASALTSNRRAVQ